MARQVAIPTPTVAARRWRFADVELDDAEGRLFVAGREVAIQRMPLKLLRILLEAAPNSVAKNVLLARVWNRDETNLSRNALSNAVSRLRASIGDADGRLVVGRPGVGYGLHSPVDVRTIVAAEPSPPPQAPAAPTDANPFMTRLWIDAMKGCSGGDGPLNLYDVLCAGIDRAESELASAPLALAHFHAHLAENCLVRIDHESAIRHFRRALAVAPTPEPRPVSDALLQIHFDLCRTLANSVLFDATPENLVSARRELALAHAALRRSPHASAATLLKATTAAWFLAYFEDDWERAVDLAQEVVRRADDMAELDARQWWIVRYNHAMTLVWAGREDDAVRAIETLLHTPARPIPRDDIVHRLARVFQGNIYVMAGRAGAAVEVLAPLHDELSGSGSAANGLGHLTAVWLGQALMATGRTAEALPVLLTAHRRALAQRGASSEMALQVLRPLAYAMADAGDADRALQWLGAGTTPRLARLSMPGQRHAVMAVACRIDLLLQRGGHEEARSLLRHLRPRDLRSAMAAPARASQWLTRSQAALRAHDGPDRFRGDARRKHADPVPPTAGATGTDEPA